LVSRMPLVLEGTPPCFRSSMRLQSTQRQVHRAGSFWADWGGVLWLRLRRWAAYLPARSTPTPPDADRVHEVAVWSPVAPAPASLAESVARQTLTASHTAFRIFVAPTA
jgi:hypothetical protein